MLFGLVSCNQVYGGDDAMGSIKLKLGADILHIGWIIHQTKMFPVIEPAGFWMTDGEIREKRNSSKMERTLVAEGNPLGENQSLPQIWI